MNSPRIPVVRQCLELRLHACESASDQPKASVDDDAVLVARDRIAATTTTDALYEPNPRIKILVLGFAGTQGERKAAVNGCTL